MRGRELDTGMNLGRYRLEERIGEGGMGSVWRARDEVLERDVALKALPSMLVTEAQARRRFEREARAMGRLQHPNVVGIYDIGTADPGTGGELPFLVLELIDGQPLSELAGRKSEPRRVLHWMEQVARALAAAHAAGIVHRDLKPSNIMVDHEDHVVVLDFGLAVLTRRDGEVSEETLTTPGMVLGSCPYMAPEQALGRGVTGASDIFSFGSVLYEALTGERAFKGETPMRVLQAVVRCTCVPAEDLAPGLPTAVYEIIDRCMAKDPDGRYRDAVELARDIATVLEVEFSSASGATTLVSSSKSVVASRLRRVRHRRIVAAAAAVAVGVGALAGLWFGRSGWEPARPDPGRWSVAELVQGTGNLFRPDWSPDGKLIAAARTDGGKGEVLVIPLEGDDPRVLVEGGGHEIPGEPDFSPESAAVAISVLTGESQKVQVVPAVGGPPVVEIENALHGRWLDRNTLLFSRDQEGRSSIWTLNLETDEEKMLVEAREDGLSWWEARPRPGGGFALLGGATDQNHGIFVSDAEGSKIEEWLAPGSKVSGVDWVPDGGSLVASVGGQLVRLTGERIQPLLPKHHEPLKFPAFAADGRLAAVGSLASYDIVSVDPDGGGWECVLCNVPRAGWGSVGSSGALLFRRRQAREARVYLRQEDGLPRPLTGVDEAASCPVFSPDETRVAYLANVEGTTELRVRSREGGEPVILARGLETSEFVSWSPDGGSIAFAGGSPLRVQVVSAAGGRVRDLSGPGGDYPTWSPDGSLVAYTVWTEASDPEQGTWVIDLDGGEPTKVSDIPTRVVWDPMTGDLLQLRRPEGDDALELWRADPASWSWSKRSRLSLGGRPPVHLEFLPLTVDPASGRLVMNRLTVESRLVVFDGVDTERW
ncbi:MAG: protein kinase [Thermoanaerobaculales bacterium]|jgi:Tol biopolymer transport system component|nr:protein kinase [Thermoanaerobaculales bacterium]